MSLKVSGERLLAEALAEAMDRDLADVPSGEQLERQHRFSGKFVRRMKRLEAAAKEGREVTDVSELSGAPGKRIVNFTKWGARTRQYGVLAAVFVCVVGLVAVVGVTGQPFRMDGSGVKENVTEDSAAADTAAPEEMDDAASDDACDDTVSEEASDDAASDDAWVDEGKGESSDTGRPEDEQEAAAPDWQEQILSESAKADELARWHLNTIYEDGSIGLSSEVVSSGEGAADRTLYATAVYEVYYEQDADDWVCVYRTERIRNDYSEEGSWDEWYAPEDLNMTRAGTYRLVRQVGSYRQVLQLTLDER